MIAPFVKRFKAALLRRFHWQISKVYQAILIKNYIFVVVLSIESLVQIALQ